MTCWLQNFLFLAQNTASQLIEIKLCMQQLNLHGVTEDSFTRLCINQIACCYIIRGTFKSFTSSTARLFGSTHPMIYYYNLDSIHQR
jgi:hypothetical protein